MSPVVAALSADEAAAELPRLAAILADCVGRGASISFMAPFTRAEARDWWGEVIEAVRQGRAVLLAARLDGEMAGSVLLGLDLPPNQPHRGEVRKLIVHGAARRRGVAAALMRGLEDAARARGLTLLTLDTATGSDAERLYRGLGWTETGLVPGYAMWPDGGFCDATFFWKRL